LHCSAIAAAAGKFGKNIGNPLATFIHLPDGGTRKWLPCLTTAAGQVEEIIGNPLATA
jgi:hypothetical protein